MTANIKAFGRFSLLLILSTVMGAGLWGQIGTQATFTGVVKDATGGIVAGATVTATNVATGGSQTASTNQDGLYRIQLPPGHYRLESAQAGFRAEVHNDIELTVGQVQEVDFTLQVGLNTETVTVTSEAPLVDTSTSTVSSLVGEQQVQDLPLNGRDYSQLIYLTPGVGNGGGNINIGRANTQFELNGAPATSTRYMMDGAEMSGAGTTTNTLPVTASLKFLGVESLSEFAVVDSNGDASVGKDEGGQINMVTRSGTNSFHGSAYEFFRSNIFDAANYFSPTVLPLTRNNFGGSIGGPIRKNKTFFFFNFEQYKDREGQALVSPLPTPAVLGIGYGGVEQVPTGQIVNGVCQIASISPTTGNQTLNVVGTALSTAPAGLGAVQASNSILNFFPSGTTSSNFLNGKPQFSSNGCPTGVQLVNLESVNFFDDHYVMGRVDHQISDKQSIFARYLIQKGNRQNALNDHLNQFAQVFPDPTTQLFTLGHRYTFSNGLLHQFTFSFNRGYYLLLIGLYPDSLFSQSAIPSALNLLPPPNTTSPAQVGEISTSNILFTMNASTPNEYHFIGRSVYEGDEQLSKNVGQHFLQGGVQFQRFFISDASTGDTTGVLTFPTLLALAQGVPSTFAGVLPCCSNAFRNERQFYIGTYLQDSYKVRSNLTVNVGLRWEFMSIAQERHDRFINWYPVLGGDGACAATITCYPAFPTFANGGFPASISEPGLIYPAASVSPINHSGNWAPRVGFAWNVFGSGKTSVRGGFGMFYNQIQINPSPTAPYYIGTASVTSKATNGSSGTVASIPWPTPGTLLTSAAANIVQPTGTVPNPEIPTMLQYNLTVQQEVAPQTTLNVAYVGNEAYHQYRTGLANLPAVVSNAAGQLAFPSMTPLTSGTTGTGSLVVYDANSDYNSFQATLERRLSHGLQLKAIFAWSKSLADSPDVLAGSPDTLTATGILNDRAYDKGPLPFNVGKNFTLNWNYDLPLGKHDKLAGLALNGWEFGGIYHQQSGTPISLQEGVAQLFSQSSDLAGRASYNPAFSGSPINSGAAERVSPSYLQYFNPAAFVPAPYGVLGNTAQGALSGPGLADVDVSLMKYINFTERIRLQFRVDAFNLLNHPNFGAPGLALYTGVVNSSATSAAGATAANSCFIGTATGSGIATTTACGQTQYAAGEINPVGVVKNGTAGQISATSTDNRELQFALKLVF